MEFDEIVDELYGLSPGDFVEARESEVKKARADGDRDLANRVHALRRPTTGAWLVNLLVRAEHDDVEQLLALGESLRDAQATLAGTELRTLSAERRRVIEALGRRVRALAADAGHSITAESQREVEATLEAALADPQASAAVASGRLTTALQYSGFGEVDIEGAVAAPVASRPAPPAARTARPAARERKSAPPEVDRAAERRRARLEQAQRAVADAEQDERATADRVTESDEKLAAAVGERNAAAEAVDRLTAELGQARDDLATAERAVQRADRERDRAKRAADSAAKRVNQARAALEDLDA